MVAIMLAFVNDIPANFLIGILFPTGFIFGGLLRLFHFSTFPTWAMVLLVALSAAGNAVWYMLVTEALRLPIEKLKSS